MFSLIFDKRHIAKTYHHLSKESNGELKITPTGVQNDIAYPDTNLRQLNTSK